MILNDWLAAADAIRRDDWQTLESIFRGADADPDGKGPRGRTLLHEAAGAGKLVAARFLLERGAYVDSADRDQDTPLDDAIRGGDYAMAQLLISFNADVNRRVGADSTPLLLAVNRRNPDLVNLLLASGADTGARLEGGCSLLGYAVTMASADADERLLDPSSTGKEREEVEVVAALVAAGARADSDLERRVSKGTPELREVLAAAGLCAATTAGRASGIGENRGRRGRRTDHAVSE